MPWARKSNIFLGICFIAHGCSLLSYVPFRVAFTKIVGTAPYGGDVLISGALMQKWAVGGVNTELAVGGRKRNSHSCGHGIRIAGDVPG